MYLLILDPVCVAVDTVDKQRKPFVRRSDLLLVRKRFRRLALVALNDSFGNIYDRILNERVFFLEFCTDFGKHRVIPIGHFEQMKIDFFGLKKINLRIQNSSSDR